MIVVSSQDLRRRVCEHIHEMAKKDLASSYPDFKFKSDEDASELLSRLSMWPLVDKYDVIPKQWLSPMLVESRTLILGDKRFEKKGTGEHAHILDSRQIEFLFWRWENLGNTYHTDPHLSYRFVDTAIHFHASKHAVWRPGQGGYQDPGNPRPEITPEILAFMDDKYPGLAGLETVRTNFSLMKEVKELREKWHKIDKQIFTVLSTYKTVNQAVAKVPQVKLYLPAPYLERLDREMTKKQREKYVEPTKPEIDTELLATMGVSHLLTKGE